MGLTAGGGATDKIAKQQRADEVARQQRITSGMSSVNDTFSKFDDGFYADRSKAYDDYAMPTVEQQAQEQRKNLIYALSRHGNLGGSAAINKNAELDRDTNAARIDVANHGLDVANQTRADVENARSGVVAQLNATGDASGASQAALRETQRLGQPTGFTPLGQLFQNFASGVSAIGSNPNNGYSGFLGGSPLFGAGNFKGSSQVVRAG